MGRYGLIKFSVNVTSKLTEYGVAMTRDYFYAVCLQAAADPAQAVPQAKAVTVCAIAYRKLPGVNIYVDALLGCDTVLTCR
jgi:hypothetical protein